MNLIWKLKNNRKYFYTALIFFFVLISILAVLPFWSTGYLYSGSDMQFHLSRIQEMVDDIHQGSLFTIPRIATHTFNQCGDAVVSCYPWVTLYPFVFLMLIFKPVSAIYLGMAFYIFLALVIAYFSMNQISKSRKIDFYFAILYGYASFFIFNMRNFEMGTALAYPFFPLAIVGLYLIMFKNYQKWYLLTLGTIGVMYSHTPSSLILIYTLAVLFIILFRFQTEKEKRFLYLLKAAGTTLLLSLIVWAPIISTLVSQKVSRSLPNVLSGSNVLDIGEILFGTFTSFSSSLFNYGLGITTVMALIFGWMFIKKIPKIAQYLYLAGLISIFVISIVFPWYLVQFIPILNTIDGIQTTTRMIPIAILFMSGFGAYLLAYLDSKNDFYKETSKVLITITILFNLFGGISLVNTKSNIAPNNQGLKAEPQLNYKANFGHKVPMTQLSDYKVNNHEYYNQFPEENASGMTDYIPIKSSKGPFNSIAYHNLNYNNTFTMLNKKNEIRPKTNSIIYHPSIEIKKGQEIDLPLINYQNVNYIISINHEEVKYQRSNQRGTIIFKSPFNINDPVIRINYLGSHLNTLTSLISIISWLVFIYFIDSKKLRSKVI